MIDLSVSDLIFECLKQRIGPSVNEIPDLDSRKLFGPEALLESLDFINFIVEVEEKISSQFHKNANLRQKILDHGMDSLKTFGSFKLFVARVLDE